MPNLLDNRKPEFESHLYHYKEEIATLRTGRVAPAMVENIMINAYGTRMPLIQLASINVSEPRQLAVQPFDKSNTQAIERAISQSDLGFGVIAQENIIRLVMPQMTAERRQEIVKSLHEKSEKARIAIRGLRDKIREEIVKQEKNKEISEDDKYRLQEELDKLTREYTDKVGEICERKEQEVTAV